MEWIEQIITKHTKEDGTVDTKALNEDIDKEFPKHAVTKNVYNTKAKEASEHKKALEDLQADSAALEDIKQERDRLQAELTNERISYKTETALKDAGGTKLDYLKYRLGELELDEDGNVKGLDDKLKELKEQEPEFFAGSEPDGQEEDNPADKETAENEQTNAATPPGYQILDNGLENGNDNPEAAIMSQFEQSVGIRPAATD